MTENLSPVDKLNLAIQEFVSEVESSDTGEPWLVDAAVVVYSLARFEDSESGEEPVIMRKIDYSIVTSPVPIASIGLLVAGKKLILKDMFELDDSDD